MKWNEMKCRDWMNQYVCIENMCQEILEDHVTRNSVCMKTLKVCIVSFGTISLVWCGQTTQVWSRTVGLWRRVVIHLYSLWVWESTHQELNFQILTTSVHVHEYQLLFLSIYTESGAGVGTPIKSRMTIPIPNSWGKWGTLGPSTRVGRVITSTVVETRVEVEGDGWDAPWEPLELGCKRVKDRQITLDANPVNRATGHLRPVPC
jgi:hypothetical protein